jgi:hypothetical protein
MLETTAARVLAEAVLWLVLLVDVTLVVALAWAVLERRRLGAPIVVGLVLLAAAVLSLAGAVWIVRNI